MRHLRVQLAVADDVLDQAVVAVVVVDGEDLDHERADEAVLDDVCAVRRHLKARRVVVHVEYLNDERDVTG